MKGIAQKPGNQRPGHKNGVVLEKFGFEHGVICVDLILAYRSENAIKSQNKRQNRPFCLIEIYNPVMAENLRQLFKNS